MLEFAITIFRDVFKPAQVRLAWLPARGYMQSCLLQAVYATDLFATDQMNRPATLGRSTGSRSLCLSSCKHKSTLPALYRAHHMPRTAFGTRPQLQPYGTTCCSASIPPPPSITHCDRWRRCWSSATPLCLMPWALRQPWPWTWASQTCHMRASLPCSWAATWVSVRLHGRDRAGCMGKCTVLVSWVAASVAWFDLWKWLWAVGDLWKWLRAVGEHCNSNHLPQVSTPAP